MALLNNWRSLRVSQTSCLCRVACLFRRFVQTTDYSQTHPSQLTEVPEVESETSDTKVSKIVNVAIIGATNAGKSTLINQIVGRKVCAASKKVHTTRKLARAMTAVDDTQIIFLDTPGIVTNKEQKKYELPNSMIESYNKSLRIADVVGVLHDVTGVKARECLHWDVSKILQDIENIPCFLILNKVDMLREKKPLLTMIRMLTNGVVGGRPVPGPPVTPSKNTRTPRGYSHFSDVFMVSALRGDGVDDVKQYLINNAKPRNAHYKAVEWTDQTPEHLIEETVRAKLLDFLPQEIPYRLTTQLEYYSDMPDRIVTCLVVTCPTARISRLVGGSGGGRINQIQSVVKAELTNMFRKAVTVEIRLAFSRSPSV